MWGGWVGWGVVSRKHIHVQGTGKDQRQKPKEKNLMEQALWNITQNLTQVSSNK